MPALVSSQIFLTWGVHYKEFCLSEDLWEALENASNKPVAQVMSTWTKQMGYPVLSVEGKQVILLEYTRTSVGHVTVLFCRMAIGGS